MTEPGRVTIRRGPNTYPLWVWQGDDGRTWVRPFISSGRGEADDLARGEAVFAAWDARRNGDTPTT